MDALVRVVAVLVFFGQFSIATLCATAGVKLIGTAQIPGDASDRSGFGDLLEGGIPHNRLGGISAIEFTGGDDRYLLLADRGPADGALPYRCRWHAIKLKVEPARTPAVTVELLSTTLLQTEHGAGLVGAASAIDADDAAQSLRFDPEAIRGDRHGHIFISDEYGPSLYEFDLSGKRSRVLKMPQRFSIAHPAAEPAVEARQNKAGRQTNGGMEGLAITPDGGKLYAAMQRPLIQDSRPGSGSGQKRIGTNTRIVELDLVRGGTRELLYPLDDTANGVSEILAVNSHQFLVLERDGRPGEAARSKRIFKIDIEGASDLSGQESLPSDGVPEGVAAVRKEPFLNLLAPEHGLAGPSFPEKIEGLAFGPDLADGRRLLVVAVDNDFQIDSPIRFYAFAIDRADLPDFGW
jgi:hypothetical protein